MLVLLLEVVVFQFFGALKHSCLQVVLHESHLFGRHIGLNTVKQIQIRRVEQIT